MRYPIFIFLILLLLISPVYATNLTNWAAYKDSWIANNDTHTVIMWNATGNHTWMSQYGVSNVTYLLVAGGGAGGYYSSYGGGGGGAGGFLTGTIDVPQGVLIPVFMGTGGLNGAITAPGEDTTFNATSLQAKGGGYGGRNAVAGGTGGSGGGGTRTYAPGSNTSGQGFAGGYSVSSSQYGGGGGGGAGEVGYNGSTTVGGNGGNGLPSNITGVLTYYAGGGAGKSVGSNTSTGGLGGGGNSASTGSAGAINTGGGGGGGTSAAGNGGSGIVIISFITPELITQFNSSPNPVQNGDPAYFVDSSTGYPTSWNWSFGDGNYSNDQYPNHTYPSSGTYTVALNISNKSGYYNSTSQQQIVIENFTPWVSKNDYWIRKNGTHTIIMWNATGLHTFVTPINVTNVSYLVVAGGGSGGSRNDYGSGGGGGGGVRQGTLAVSGNISILVGTGGIHDSSTRGENSQFGSISSTGGGYGGYYSTAPGSGGSGGGGSGYSSSTDDPGANTSGQGFYGGWSTYTLYRSGGGGGGAGEPGYDGTLYRGGNGGKGIISRIQAGIETYYGGGGGGTVITTGYQGTGGIGGGGNAGGTGVSGTNGLGGGGGAGISGSGSYGGAGGSGIVMIAFETPSLLANFTGHPDPVQYGDPMYFNDLSDGYPVSWNWSFGDGNYSEEQHPNHTYPSIGIYNVTLNISNSTGTFNQSLKDVTVITNFTPWVAYGNAWKRKNESYTIVMWNVSGTYDWLVSGNVTKNVTYLVVGGGGAGGGRTDYGSGGGGAGGMKEGSINVSSYTNLTIVVGTGGTSNTATDGGSSSFGSISSNGGGNGGYYSSAARSGGSGGGGSGYGSSTDDPGANVSGQGFYGGWATYTNYRGGGGGGGAGEPGYDGSLNRAGNGGKGKISRIQAGIETHYAGGGGGSVLTSGLYGLGGIGGGGNSVSSGGGYAGVNGTGGGGGAGLTTAGGGKGGTGIVMIAYETEYFKPTASFIINVSNRYYEQPSGIICNDTSANLPETWNWTITNVTGNNTPLLVGTDKNLSITVYNGNWSIDLNVSNIYGFTNTSQFVNISIAEAPTSNFTHNYTWARAPTIIQFNDTSLYHPTSWVWNVSNIIGNNTSITVSTDENPLITMYESGSWLVSLEVSNYNGSSISSQLINISEPWISYGDGYKANNTTHTTIMWNTTGSYTWLATDNTSTISEYLIVAGGGSGGSESGTNYQEGGGGGGGVIHGTNYDVSGLLTVVVGAGGSGTSKNGSNSTFGIYSAKGGGGGGMHAFSYGFLGGSGGGGRWCGAGGSNVSGQGFYGGTGPCSLPYSSGGGGGGGAGEPGHDGNTTWPGQGGDGTLYYTSGNATYYSGGGAGGAYANSTTGGLGGGGDSRPHGQAGIAGQANTGGGGGGGGTSGGNGGSGIVYIIYITSAEDTPPRSSFIINASNIYYEAPSTINCTDTSEFTPTTWNWTVTNVTGNNTPILVGTDQNLSTILYSGNWSINLNVSNNNGFNNSQQFVNLSIAYPPTSNFTINSTIGRISSTVQFNDTSGVHPSSWEWIFTNTTGNNTPIIFNSSQNTTYTFGVGRWLISLIAENDAGNNTSSQYIDVSGPWSAYGDAWLSENGTQRFIMWNSSGNYTWMSTGNTTEVNYLVVAGGGGSSGTAYGGGGGAGGMLTGLNYNVSGLINITVGAGGSYAPTSGQNSSFANTTPGDGVNAKGGGTGTENGAGGNGGSGGGGSYYGANGTGIPGQGHNGGYGSGYRAGGGGGGAGENGTAAPAIAQGGRGGNGSISSISGENIYYAGGGGGGDSVTGTYSASGGLGGGGNGGYRGYGGNGTNGLGGGGGGGSEYPSSTYYHGGNGGSGVVIISYLLPEATIPTANFTQNVSTGLFSLPVMFNDTSTGVPTSWNWSFGDGSVSSEQHTIHTYTSGGNYTVNLTVTNEEGSSTKISYVEVWNTTTSAFTGSPTSGTVPLSVEFTGVAENGTTYFWIFGDGNTTNNNVLSPEHTYFVSGEYSVNFSVSNGHYTNWTNRSLYISAENVDAPTADFTQNVSTGLFSLPVMFNDTSSGSPTSWNWSFGDGVVSANQNNTHTYTSGGNYTVNLTVTNDGGSSTKISYVEVWNTTTSAFTGSPTSGTVPLSVEFTGIAGNGTTYFWIFGDGNTTNNNILSPEHLYKEAGTYSVNFSVSNDHYTNWTNRSLYITVNQIDAPTANFVSNVSTGLFSLPVMFNDTSSGSPTSWNWSFGDGVVSANQNNTHTYTSGGNYTVNLTVTNDGGSSTKISYVEVWNTTTSAFTGSPTSGTVPLSVQFTGVAGNGTTYFWIFGDGNTTNNNILSPEHLYKEAGTYSVNFSVGNDHYTNWTNRSLYISADGIEPPVAFFIPNISSGIFSLPVNFIDGSTGTIDSWNWSFGDGTFSENQNPTHIFTTGGNYTVNLTVTNDGGSSSYNSTVTVWNRTTSGFEASPDIGYNPLSVQFTGTSENGTTYLWIFGDGNTTNNNILSPEHTYFIPGTYSVNFSVSNSHYTNWTNRSNYIIVIETVTPPTASFTQNVSTGLFSLPVMFNDTSSGSPTSWNWSFGDGIVSSNQNNTHTYTSGGNYTVNLTVTNEGGSSTKISYVEVWNTTTSAFTGSPIFGDSPLSVDFTGIAGNGTTYFWIFGDGNTTNNNVLSPEHTYFISGTYSINFSVNNGHYTNWTNRSNYISVSEPPETPPVANFVSNVTNGVFNLPVTFTDTSTGTIDSWNWSFGDGTISSSHNPSHTFTSGGNYTINLTVSNSGGSDTKFAYITVWNRTTSAFTGSPTSGSFPLSVQFTGTAGNGTTYLWIFGDGNTTNNNTLSPEHTYLTSGTYSVNFSVSNGHYTNWTNRSNYITDSAVPPLSITDLTNTTSCSGIIWTWINPPDIDFAGTIIYLDNTYVTTLPNTTYRYTFTTGSNNTNYTISVRTYDLNNNVNSTFVNNTANNQHPECPTRSASEQIAIKIEDTGNLLIIGIVIALVAAVISLIAGLNAIMGRRDDSGP